RAGPGPARCRRRTSGDRARRARYRHRGAARGAGEDLPDRLGRGARRAPQPTERRRGRGGRPGRGARRRRARGPGGLGPGRGAAAAGRGRGGARHHRPGLRRGAGPTDRADRDHTRGAAMNEDHGMDDGGIEEITLDHDPADGVWDDEQDRYALDAEFADELADETAPLQIVAIIGRPNVGKSTLVNRIIGRREAVVEDTPGVTRDRVTYDAEWVGTRFLVQDTGGWEPEGKGLQEAISTQAALAMREADVIVLVVDAVVGATATDEAVVRTLRRSKTPVVLAANKVDGERQEAEAAALWSLGMGEPFPISAVHGRGTGDLLD